MRTRYSILFKLLGVALLAISSGIGADYQVVASKDFVSDSISADELKRVFMLTKNTVGGAKVTPVVQKAGAAHEAMLKDCLGIK